MTADLVAFLHGVYDLGESLASNAFPYQTGSRYEDQPFPWVHFSEAFSPDFIKADFAARRRRVDLLEQIIRQGGSDRELAVRLLSLEALPFAAHYDYRPEWAPDA